jgi:hypothetical protein
MSKKGKGSDATSIGRREALWWLVGAPIHLGLLSSVLSASAQRPPQNLRIVSAQNAAADSPVARNLFPRTFVNPATLSNLRSQLGRDAAFRARWQTAIAQFETGAGTRWTANPTVDAYTLAFGAFLACVRANGDQGLTWGASRQAYIERILTGVYTNSVSKNGQLGSHAAGVALIYDFLHADLTAQQRADFRGWVQAGYDRGRWSSQRNHWDGGASNDHMGKLFSALVMDDAAATFPAAYGETIAAVESQNWMGWATGSGYEWSGDVPRFAGYCSALLALKNAGGLTDADTFDRFTTHLRDSAQLVRQFTIPHPSLAVRGNKNYTDRVHQEGPLEYKSLGLNVGAHIVWALTVLPGKVQVSNAASYSSRASLARSEADFLGYLAYELNRPVPGAAARSLRHVIEMNGIANASPTTTRGGTYTFFTFPAWLILNAREAAPVDPDVAGIPKVRRWWPGTLEWTTIRSDLGATMETTGSAITYHHRRYWMNNYETGVHQNGSWHVHRAGPLLIQRGSASHGPISRKATWGANGTVSFVDQNEWPRMYMVNRDDFDEGGIRSAGGTRRGKAEILAEPLLDFGEVTNWFADEQVVAITSNLLRSYNGTAVQFGAPDKNQPKISAFTREFVCVQRGADGTDHERVFTYDRIALLDTKFQPRYNLCPGPPQVTIDGTERAVEPWGGTSDPAATADGKFPWRATGPNHWRYTGANHMTVDNVTEPQDATPGAGKARVTWLQPAGNAAVVVKRGGTSAQSLAEPLAEGQPGYNEFGAWMGLDGEWHRARGLDKRAYAGLFTVSISPATVTPDTRFLMACDVMPSDAAPDVAATLNADSGSVAARCGASAVVFARDATARSAGSVTIPAGVNLVVLVNLPSDQTRTVSAGGGLSITTSGRRASSSGVLTLGVNGSGELRFS